MEKLDFSLFREQVLAEQSTLAAFLKGHLWIEHVLNMTLEQHMVNASAMNISREQFARKLNLAHALGAIHPDWHRWIMKANTYRNQLAHNLHHTVTREDVISLCEAVAKNVHPGFFQNQDTRSTRGLLNEWFLFVVEFSHLFNLQREYDKKYSAILHRYAGQMAATETFEKRWPTKNGYEIPPPPPPDVPPWPSDSTDVWSGYEWPGELLD